MSIPVAAPNVSFGRDLVTFHVLRAVQARPLSRLWPGNIFRDLMDISRRTDILIERQLPVSALSRSTPYGTFLIENRASPAL
jgi:hypothetical protein